MAMNKNKFLLVLCFLGMMASFNAQVTTKYFVKLNNKNGGNPYSLSNPSAFLTPAAIARRATYGVPYHITDLPVTPAYVSQIAAVPSVTVLYVSKWLNGVVVSFTNTSVISTINSFSFVTSTNPVNRYKLDVPPVAQPNNLAEEQMRTEAAPTATFNYGASYWQNHQIGADCLHSQGFRGQGMVIAVLDAGFLNANNNHLFDSLFNRGGVLGTRDFVSGGTNVYDDDLHGAEVLSCLAAIKPGSIMGSAPRANYWLLRTEDNASPNPYNESISEEYNWVRGAEFADSVGAQVLTTSLGYTVFDKTVYNHTYADLDGKTAAMSIAANLAARKGLLCLNAAGNGNGSGWSKISIPADADSICTVGAIDTLGNVASFSSIGPTADNRIKPDLVARGLNSCVTDQNGTVQHGSGTSFATPILAGAMACFWQAHPSFNAYKVIDTLRKTASNHITPNNSIGWGAPNMCAVAITGIAQNSRDNNLFNFIVSPNPFNSLVSIKLEQLTPGSVTVQFYDVLGKTIKTVKEPNPSATLNYDLGDLSAGVYFVKVSNANAAGQLKKIVKQ